MCVAGVARPPRRALIRAVGFSTNVSLVMMEDPDAASASTGRFIRILQMLQQHACTSTFCRRS